MVESARSAGERLVWQEARIEALESLSPRIIRVVLRPQAWHLPLAGQHLDVRLTAEDGYQAQRSYSLLSPPDRDGVYELGIERLADGEVSPWFHDAAQVGESIEVYGPVGGHFVWSAALDRPALLIGGGSGVVPLLSMAAHRAHLAIEQRADEFERIVYASGFADAGLGEDLQRERFEPGADLGQVFQQQDVVHRDSVSRVIDPNGARMIGIRHGHR